MFGYIILVIAIYLIIGFIIGKMMEGFPCVHCGYEVEATEDNTVADDSTRCPHCDRKITVPTGTMSAQCPWCGKNIIF